MLGAYDCNQYVNTDHREKTSHVLIMARSLRLPLHPLGGANYDGYTKRDFVLGHTNIQRLACFEVLSGGLKDEARDVRRRASCSGRRSYVEDNDNSHDRTEGKVSRKQLR